MKFALVIYETAEELARRNNAEAPAYWAAWKSYSEALRAAGVITGGACLQLPSTASNVTFKGDKKLVQDGPFADSKEQLGGFMIIDVPGVDQAIEWAKRAPVGSGAVETRPILVM